MKAFNDTAGSSVSWKLVSSVLCASTLVTTAVLYQRKVDTEWHAIPAAEHGDLDAMQARLAAIDDLLDRRPLWIGAKRAMSERTDLSTGLQVLRTQRVLSDSRDAERRQFELADAASSRMRGLELAGKGEYAAALPHFEHALEVAPEGWSETEQVRRDIASIHDWLEEQEP